MRVSTKPASLASAADPWLSKLHSDGVLVLERGWLSSNNVLLLATDQAAVVDTGYASHADLTVSLVRTQIGARSLSHILNTHLHSDHCGGNAALQAAWPQARLWIPPGLADAVAVWDRDALTHRPTGQRCERFRADSLLQPGKHFVFADLTWEVWSADGHDPHSIIMFERSRRWLISADALWANGFGVVFPELDGEAGFEAVRDTLDLIQGLAPEIVIPGHGPVFGGTAVTQALELARRRLDQFVADPARHRRHALKVLIKFKMLEWQSCAFDELEEWFLASDYFVRIAAQDAPHDAIESLQTVVSDLVRSGALRIEEDLIVNC